MKTVFWGLILLHIIDRKLGNFWDYQDFWLFRPFPKWQRKKCSLHKQKPRNFSNDRYNYRGHILLFTHSNWSRPCSNLKTLFTILVILLLVVRKQSIFYFTLDNHIAQLSLSLSVADIDIFRWAWEKDYSIDMIYLFLWSIFLSKTTNAHAKVF